MIRFVFRFVGLWLLAAAFIFVVYDGTKSIADKAFEVTSLEKTWNEVSSQSLQALQPTIERNAKWLWDPLMLRLLATPTWAILGVLGVLLIIAGRKKKPLIGYGRD
jgi:hypothetical protein